MGATFRSFRQVLLVLLRLFRTICTQTFKNGLQPLIFERSSWIYGSAGNRFSSLAPRGAATLLTGGICSAMMHCMDPIFCGLHTARVHLYTWSVHCWYFGCTGQVWTVALHLDHPVRSRDSSPSWRPFTVVYISNPTVNYPAPHRWPVFPLSLLPVWDILAAKIPHPCTPFPPKPLFLCRLATFLTVFCVPPSPPATPLSVLS